MLLNTLIVIGAEVAYTYSLVTVIFPVIIPENVQHHGRMEVCFEGKAVPLRADRD